MQAMLRLLSFLVVESSSPLLGLAKRVQPQGLVSAKVNPGEGGITPSNAEWLERYDFSVSIERKRPDGKWSQCSGTIAGRSVLTAAHCIVDDQGNIRPTEELFVRAADGVVRDVTSAVAHPGYNLASNHECPDDPRVCMNRYDVGILTLSSEWSPSGTPAFLDGIGPPEEGEGVFLAAHGSMHDMYGFIGSPGVLRVIHADQMKVEKCVENDTFEKWSPENRSKKEIQFHDVLCVGSGPLKASSCGGDSGGGWYVPRMVSPDGTSRGPGSVVTKVIIGVNSFGYEAYCGHMDKRTGMALTSKSFVRKFIEEHTDDFKFTHTAVAEDDKVDADQAFMEDDQPVVKEEPKPDKAKVRSGVAHKHRAAVVTLAAIALVGYF